MHFQWSQQDFSRHKWALKLALVLEQANIDEAEIKILRSNANSTMVWKKKLYIMCITGLFFFVNKYTSVLFQYKHRNLLNDLSCCLHIEYNNIAYE